MDKSFKWYDGVLWRPTPDPVGARLITNVPATVTTLVVSPATAAPGATLTLTATVKKTDGTSVTTGKVVFKVYDGSSWSTITTDSANPWTTTISAPSARRTYQAAYDDNNSNATYLPSSSNVPFLPTTTQTYVKTFNCVGSASYQQGGAKETWFGTDVYQGYYSSGNGIQRSVMLFPYASIQSALSGYDSIDKVELYLNAEHWGPDNGGTAIIVDHNYASLPASSPAYSTGYASTAAWATKTGAKWCNLNVGIGAKLAAGTAKGVGLYVTSGSTNVEYYGYMSGYGSSAPPVLRITYKK